MNPKLLVTIGASGCGKTTWARKYLEDNPKSVRVNRDDLRKQITGLTILGDNYYHSPNPDHSKEFARREMRITDVAHEQIRYWLSKGYNVVLDNTHLQKKYLDEILMLYNHLADIYFVPFITKEDTDYELLSERVKNRDGLEDTSYIKRQLDQLKNLSIEKVFYPKTVERLEFNSDLPPAIVCDLDGTLCLYGDADPYDRNFEMDFINEPVLDVLNGLFCTGHHILFLSGRNGKFFEATNNFLSKYFQPHTYSLYMRDETDFRKDYVVKEEMIRALQKENEWNILFAIDDRLSVIEQVWNKLGIFCLNVNQNNKRF